MVRSNEKWILWSSFGVLISFIPSRRPFTIWFKCAHIRAIHHLGPQWNFRLQKLKNLREKIKRLNFTRYPFDGSLWATLSISLWGPSYPSHRPSDSLWLLSIWKIINLDSKFGNFLDQTAAEVQLVRTVRWAPRGARSTNCFGNFDGSIETRYEMNQNELK